MGTLAYDAAREVIFRFEKSSQWAPETIGCTAQDRERLDHYSSQLATLKIDLLIIIPFVKPVPHTPLPMHPLPPNA